MLINLLKLTAYALSLCGFLFYVHKIVDNFFFEPDIGTIEKFIAADTIPFPAITICSPMIFKNNFDQTFYDVLLYKDSLRNLSIDEQNLLPAKSQICLTNTTRMMAILEITKNRTRRDFVNLMKEKSLEIDETFYDCYDEEGHKPCREIFVRSLTDIGICYTYNMQSYHTILNKNVISSDFYSLGGKSDEISREDWSLESGYSTDDENLFPRRFILYTKKTFGMAISNSHLNRLCQIFKKKIRFIFHLPNEIPTSFHRFETISINTKLRLSISATAYATDKRLKKYAAEKRYCYFEGERKLKFFKTYTKNHCFLECFANFTLQQCNCSKFSYPRTGDAPVCDIIDSLCLDKAQYLWLKSEKKLSKSSIPCNCLPPCFNIEYQIVQSQVNEFTGKTSVNLERVKKSHPNTSFAGLVLEFSDIQITLRENFVAYNLENVIADCGGLLGLLTGFSLFGTISYFCKLVGEFLTKREARKKAKLLNKRQMSRFSIIQVEPFDKKMIEKSLTKNSLSIFRQ